MGKREQKRMNEQEQIIRALRQLPPSVPNARLAAVVGQSQSKVRRHLKRMDLPVSQKTGWDSIDALNHSIHRVTDERATKIQTAEGPKYRRKRKIHALSPLSNLIGAKVAALHLDERILELRPSEQEQFARVLRCSPLQLRRWLRAAVRQGRAIELPPPSGELLSAYRGTGLGLGEAAQIREEQRAELARHEALRRDAVLSKNERALLALVRDQEAGPIAFCAMTTKEITDVLGVSGRSVESALKSLVESGRLFKKCFTKKLGARLGRFLSERPLPDDLVRELTLKIADSNKVPKPSVSDHDDHGPKQRTEHAEATAMLAAPLDAPPPSLHPKLRVVFGKVLTRFQVAEICREHGVSLNFDLLPEDRLSILDGFIPTDIGLKEMIKRAKKARSSAA